MFTAVIFLFFSLKIKYHEDFEKTMKNKQQPNGPTQQVVPPQIIHEHTIVGTHTNKSLPKQLSTTTNHHHRLIENQNVINSFDFKEMKTSKSGLIAPQVAAASDYIVSNQQQQPGLGNAKNQANFFKLALSVAFSLYH